MALRLGLAIIMVMLVSACEGVIITSQRNPGTMFSASAHSSSSSSDTGSRASSDEPSNQSPARVLDVTCDPTRFPSVTLATIAAEFADQVHPMMLEVSTGCVSCHSNAAKRLFTVSGSGLETFYTARAAGFFVNVPGSILSRLLSSDSLAAMPKNSEPWSDEQVLKIARISCMLEALDSQITQAPAADEQFPPELLMPFNGPKPTSYDNTFINFLQLKGKVKTIFADDWSRGGVDQWDKNIGLFGGVNFKTNFVEARAATPEFLLGLDALAPDICGAASKSGTGPFAGMTLTSALSSTAGSATMTSIDSLYQRMLFRVPTDTERTAAFDLIEDLTGLGSVPDAWSGLCEALVHHPDFLFTLPPSADAASGPAKQRAVLVSLTQSLLGRSPQKAEFDMLAEAGFEAVLDTVLASPELQTYYFSRIQLRIETQGTVESDEPARLWTWVAMNGKPFSEILTADYTIDERSQQQARPPEHGHTGVLTMKGYLANKPGLPHFNYPARVMSAFMGTVFEVPPEVFEQRGTATATSTVDPKSICYSCHQMLTPLAYQRQRWADDGTYRVKSADGSDIDDSDHDLVEGYPYKGEGMEAFATKAVNKEPFIRRMINTQFKLLMGRDMRHADDERQLYKTLWDASVTSHSNLKAIIKAVALSDTFQRKTP